MASKISRTMIMAIAKVIRNTVTTPTNREMLVRELHKLFYLDNPNYAADQFRKLAYGTLDKDVFTDWRTIGETHDC